MRSGVGSLRLIDLAALIQAFLENALIKLI